MLSRITNAKKGIIEYLKKGRKKGRNYTRQELDERIFVLGDIDDLERAIDLTNEKFDWNSDYIHITLGFSINEQDLSPEIIRAITQEYLDFYTVGFNQEHLSFHAEYHAPKIQTIVSDGKSYQRLGHVHLVISKYDHLNDKQIRIRPFSYAAEKCFQSYICNKYNLDNPQDYLRSDPITRKDILARTKNDLADASTKKAKTSILRETFAELSAAATSLEEAKKYLLESNLVKSVRIAGSKKNRYLKIELVDDNAEDINCRGELFEHLEKFLYSPEEMEARAEAKANAKKKKTPEENALHVEKTKQGWLEKLVKEGNVYALEVLGKNYPNSLLLKPKGGALQQTELEMSGDEREAEITQIREELQQHISELVTTRTKANNSRYYYEENKAKLEEAKASGDKEAIKEAEKKLATSKKWLGKKQENLQLELEAIEKLQKRLYELDEDHKQVVDQIDKLRKRGNTELEDGEDHEPKTHTEKMERLGGLYEKYFVNPPEGKIPKSEASYMVRRSYYRMFGNNLHKDFVKGAGFKSYQDGDTKSIFNSSTGLAIKAQPNHVYVEMPKGKEEQQRAVELTIKIALDSGMSLETMRVSGNKKYVKLFEAEIERIKSDPEYQERMGLTKDAPDSDLVVEKAVEVKKTADLCSHKPEFNQEEIGKELYDKEGLEPGRNTDLAYYRSIQNWFIDSSQKLIDSKKEEAKVSEDGIRAISREFKQSRDTYVNALVNYQRPIEHEPNVHSWGKQPSERDEISTVSEVAKGIRDCEDRLGQEGLKPSIDALKELDANLLLDWAEEKLKLDKSNFKITDDNKILDERLPERAPRTTVDFITKTCSHSLTEGLQILEGIRQDQEHTFSFDDDYSYLEEEELNTDWDISQ